jgi:riboflavin-specific deaminase-like protein
MKRPFVFVNMAMTADGKIATANRAVSSFGSKRDVAHLYELRARADAVMSGARTIDSNPVYLGPGGDRYRRQRLKNGLAEYNLRVIVSGSGRLSPRAKIFEKRFSPIIVITSEAAPPGRLAVLRGLADEVVVFGEEEVDIPAALRWLAVKWKVRKLLVEGGGGLNDALFRAGVVDEINLTLCPKVIGGRSAPTIAEGRGLGALANAAPFSLASVKRIGDELFLTYRAAGRG